MSTVNRLLPLLPLLLLACAEPPAQQAWPLEVRAPVAGEVWVGEQFALVDPLAPARLEVVTPPPFTVTFLGPDGPLTLVDAPGPVVDLRLFVDAPAPIRGRIVELVVRPLEGEPDLVAVADGQVFAPTGWTDGRATLPVPDTDLILLAVWRTAGRATHITRRAFSAPGLAAGRELTLAPERPLDAALPITVDAAPGGALLAELTEDGVRTGLLLGAGRIEPGVAVAIPRPEEADPRVGLWVRVEDGSAGEPPRRVIEAALPLVGDGAALRWPAPPTVDPPARGPDRPAWFDAAARRWTVDGAADASWIELTIDGRGDCVGRPWRIIAPPGEAVVAPPAVGADPLDAPIVDARIAAVRVVGASLDDLLADGPEPVSVPGRLTGRSTAAIRGFWRTDPASCPSHPLRGLYVLDAADAACAADTPAPRAIITRCGAYAPLADGGLACGRFEGEALNTDALGPLPVEVDAGVVHVDAPPAGARLYPVPAPEARPPADAVGDWSRFELWRQPINERGEATAEPALIEAGISGAAATIGADGALTVRTARWAFAARLVDGDADAAVAEVEAAGCAARPPWVDIAWRGERVELRGEAIDGDVGRRYILDLRR